jgi:methylglutaconyl-CoA hydratase
MFETITIVTDARGVATLTLNRPDKHNALSGLMIDEVTRAVGLLDRDPAVRVVVLAAGGRSFCAGGDLAWMQAQIDADGATRAVEARKLADMLGAVNRLSKPVIARVQGNAFGGGVGLCCVCDMTLASKDAKFGLTETKLGLIPATIGPYVMARMGEGRARQVFMSSRIFDALEAENLGIVSNTVRPEDLDACVEDEITCYLECAPGAVAEAKALALALGTSPNDETVARSIGALVKRWESDEAGQGIAAFFAKTPPPWGRSENDG